MNREAWVAQRATEMLEEMAHWFPKCVARNRDAYEQTCREAAEDEYRKLEAAECRDPNS